MVQFTSSATRGEEPGRNAPDPVLVGNRNRPSRLISPQHGAVCWSAKGEDPIGDRLPLAESRNAEIVPVPVPPAANGDPASGVSVPSACRSKTPIVFDPVVLSLT